MKRPASQFRSSARRGFALLTVMWCVGIMMVTLMGFLAYVSLQLTEDTSRSKDARARTIALSGLALGLHPQMPRNDDLLAQDFGGGSFRVTVVSEGSRLNLNRLLVQGRTDVLLRLWVLWGLSPDAGQAVNDALQDWIETGDTKRLNGAKQADYAALGFPDFPPGRPFQSLDELPQVIGFDKIIALKPDWRNYFTLWSNGTLDLNEAPPDLIAAVCNVGIDMAQSFVSARDPDGVVGSVNSVRWSSVSDACSALGMPQGLVRTVSSLLSVSSTIWRIESEGILGDHHHTIQVVATRAVGTSGNASTGTTTSTSTTGTGTAPTYYLWQEF
ncbi:Type II secretory pathway, component PulK [Verrucomicrobium sp. GAS474]|uniref:general secretion pathway protein GspK n=1 Tax=Verrucomicrobium sp. GAS474 TaxID=1882831 RepID=UPI00087C16C2|nr:type II secretion system protein GspK [Verrucomicrobium sp. GAS474]SDU06627.1 Type II secretory pathway, component PulK [Verrucomicrobium sp. GAS474]